MKKISFIRDTQYPQEWLVEPLPSSYHIPQWYRSGEMFFDRVNLTTEIHSEHNKAPGLKSCIPFLDGLSSGYMLSSWAHIEIIKNDDEGIEWKYLELDSDGNYIDSEINYDMIEKRPDVLGGTIPRPVGHAFTQMTWKSRWGVKTPKNWSLIVTHPMNHFDLPFTTMSAVMDSDRFSPRGNIPFFIKKGFVGIIPKNTPYAQIIPVKRSSWMAEYRDQNKLETYIGNAARTVKYGYYRAKLWAPKKYKHNGEK